MAKLRLVPNSAFRFRDTTFLLAIGVVSLICGALAFYAWRVEIGTNITAFDEERSFPLPAGPRKYP